MKAPPPKKKKIDTSILKEKTSVFEEKDWATMCRKSSGYVYWSMARDYINNGTY